MPEPFQSAKGRKTISYGVNMAISSIGVSGLTEMTQANQTASRRAVAQKLLKEMDTDQSGTVSKDEFVAFGEKVKAQKSAPQVTNGPTPPSSDQLFTSADKNGDQSLSLDELSAMMAQAEIQSRASGALGGSGEAGRSGATGSVGGPPGGIGGASGMGGTKGGASGASVAKDSSSTSSASSNTDPADTNGDGVVSAAEKAIYEFTHPTATADSSK